MKKIVNIDKRIKSNTRIKKKNNQKQLYNFSTYN